MKNEFSLTRLAGLQLSARPSALISVIGLWIVLSAIALAVSHLPVAEAIIAGFITTLLHWVFETVHQLGHAQAARRTGYPMTGIRYWGLLSTSVYPDDEPSLPAALHIRRAFGGIPVSIASGLVVGLIALTLPAASGLWRWIAWFVAFENLFVFGLGAFLPLGFTDGSTLLHYWKQRR